MPSLVVFLFLQRQLWETFQPKHDDQSHNLCTLIGDTPRKAPQPNVVTSLRLPGRQVMDLSTSGIRSNSRFTFARSINYNSTSCTRV